MQYSWINVGSTFLNITEVSVMGFKLNFLIYIMQPSHKTKAWIG